MRIDESGVSYSMVQAGEEYRVRVDDVTSEQFYMDRTGDGVIIEVQDGGESHVAIRLDVDATERLHDHMTDYLQELDGQQAGGVTHD